jgi:predicted phosphodiesterase
MSNAEIAKKLNVNKRNVEKVVQRVRTTAEMRGYAPDQDMTRPVPESFFVKGVSSYYNKDGELSGQWVKSSISSEQAMLEAFNLFKEGLMEDVAARVEPTPKPDGEKDKKKAAFYLCGDHHLGLKVWSPETGDDPYDIDIAKTLLFNAVDKLSGMASHCDVGVFVNLGDFMHANNLKNQTSSQQHAVDVDTRMGKAIQSVGELYKRVITRMLEAHNEVVIINVRGNHDPDASLWLNEMIKLYYEKESRVTVLDNYNKFIWYEWGENLVVMHHGDKVNPQRLLEHITRLLYKEWGRCRYKMCWTGHIHHKQAHESSMLFESWNILAPADSYHSEHGYGASRSMSCVILDKEFGEHSRFKVGIDEIR